MAGDKVIWRRIDETHGVIVACCERRNLLGKPDKRGAMKAIAANIDQLIITVAPKPALSTYLIDSYLVVAESLHITPIILLNKIDMLTLEEKHNIYQQLQIYESLAYKILYASTYESHGLDTLLQEMCHKVSVIVGRSGVGKSSLVHALLPHHLIRTAEPSASEKSQHTTTASTLYHLPQGGSLVDSPGIRELSLWHMSVEQIAQSFVEFRAYLGRCRFRNCKHQQEPGCALQQAVLDGKIHSERLANYFKIVDQQNA